MGLFLGISNDLLIISESSPLQCLTNKKYVKEIHGPNIHSTIEMILIRTQH